MDAEEIVERLYNYLYFDEDEQGKEHFNPDREIDGGDTIEYLCELIPAREEDNG